MPHMPSKIIALQRLSARLTGALARLGVDLNQRWPMLLPLLRLARLDRPIGTFLLLWPTLWALWIATEGRPGWHLLVVFTLGTLFTRSAGCIVNDVVDRKIDGSVERTRNRPLVLGQVTVMAALCFTAILLFAALLLVLTTNWLTVLLAFGGAITALIYPFMKRYTYMPQAILGLAFSFGIPMAFAAATGEVPLVAGLLMIANIVWTVAFDTEYAMVDRNDDLLLGLKSSAILFAELDKAAIATLQVLFLIIMYAAAEPVGLSTWYMLGLGCAAGLFIYQQYLIRNRDRDGCFAAFLNNHWCGLGIFVGIFLHYW
jgi:4-hydroxybenzoate polyprenyltransferase